MNFIIRREKHALSLHLKGVNVPQTIDKQIKDVAFMPLMHTSGKLTDGIDVKLNSVARDLWMHISVLVPRLTSACKVAW